MPDNVAGKREVKLPFKFEIKDYEAINASEDSLSLYPQNDSVIVYQYKSGVGLYKISSGFITVYPNPAFDYLHIISGTQRIKEVAVFDALGNIVYSMEMQNKNTLEIPVSGLNKGLYYIEARTETGEMHSEFFRK